MKIRYIHISNPGITKIHDTELVKQNNPFIHESIAALFRELDKNGVMLMASNHDTPLVHTLYNGFKIETVDVRRNINCDASKRTGTEVIITNY